jgi:hypothetical protein
MDVSVDKPWEHSAPVSVQAARAPAGERRDVRRLANGDDPSSLGSKSLRYRAVLVHRPDVGVNDD